MKYLYSLILALLCLTACNSDDDKTYYFIGDQMFDNMDLDAAFPTKHIVDCAKSGMHLQELIDHPIYVPSDAVAVVLVGTHDNLNSGGVIDERIKEYCDNYEQVMTHLGAQRTIVIGLLPTTNSRVNANHFAFNREMKRRFEAYDNIQMYDLTYRLIDDDELLDVQYARQDGQLLNDYGYQVLAEAISKLL